MTEQPKDPVVVPVVAATPQDGVETLESLNEELKKTQDEYKNLRDGDLAKEEIENKKRAIEKTKEKIERLKNPQSEDKPEVRTPKGYQFSHDDVYDLREAGIRHDSEEAAVVKKFIDANLAKDVSEALGKASVKAELEAIKVSRTAKSVVDENEDLKLKPSSKDIRGKMKEGYVPTDKNEIKQAASENLKAMGLG